MMVPFRVPDYAPHQTNDSRDLKEWWLSVSANDGPSGYIGER